MPNVIVLSRVHTTFIQRDVELLKRHFQTRFLLWEYPVAPMRLVQIADSDSVLFSWFAGAHAAVAAVSRGLHRAKTIVVLGGYDCTGLDEIQYGAFLDPIRASLVRVAVRRSDAVLAVDASLVDELRRHYPTSREIHVVPTGYDLGYWAPNGEKEDLILTVGIVNRSNAARKGFHTFARMAAMTSDLQFALVGETPDPSLVAELRRLSHGNLEITGRLSDGDLRTYYRRAKVYCQLSRFEGLPNALCEAMLCQCVPVGTEWCGIPTAIGDSGEYCVYGDSEGALAAVQAALKRDGRDARERIIRLFPLENREKGLVEQVNRLAVKSH